MMTLSVGGSAVVVLVLPLDFFSWETGILLLISRVRSLSISQSWNEKKKANELWICYTKISDMRKSHLRQSGLMDGMNSEEVAFPFEITVMLCNGGVT